MSLSVLFRFLVGRRDAILTVASDRRYLAVGFLFVISAGFAREYDAEYLVREPWHVLLPLGVSLAASFLLFAMLFLLARRPPDVKPGLFSCYLPFLRVFWMTAPLAWLYAVPYERFLNAADAASANLWTLALVAAWRVILMTRATSVLFNTSPVATLWPIMLYSDVAALVASAFVPVPLLAMMGGIEVPPAVSVLASVALTVRVLGLLSLPIWLIGTVVVAGSGRLRRDIPAVLNSTAPLLSTNDDEAHVVPAPDATAESPFRGDRSRRTLLQLGWVSIAVWAFILPFTQPEQARRYEVERALQAGNATAAIELLSSHSPGEFPPLWRPPPQLIERGEDDMLLDLTEASLTSSAGWVREYYVGQLCRYVELLGWVYRDDDADRLVRAVDILGRAPEARALLRQRGLRYWGIAYRDRERRQDAAAALDKLAEMAGIDKIHQQTSSDHTATRTSD